MHILLIRELRVEAAAAVIYNLVAFVKCMSVCSVCLDYFAIVNAACSAALTTSKNAAMRYDILSAVVCCTS